MPEYSFSREEIDALGQQIIKSDPFFREEVAHIEHLLRELVTLERKKMGLDEPKGAIWLYQNKDKKQDTDPDLIGTGQVAGSSYRAAAWISGKELLKIGLIAQKRP